MNNFNYLIDNFFTNKDYLAPANQIPGTLFTPLHFIFASVLLSLIIPLAIYVAKHKNLIKPVFKTIWIIFLIWEVLIVTWESLSGKIVGFDLKTNLSLYPCSLFLYTMPFAIWGKGIVKQIACSSICTICFFGGAINFIYPAIRLSSYSCISFAGFHTFLFHGAMVFTCIVMFVSGYHRFTNIHHLWELFLPCIPTLILSIPANMVNYSKIGSDYMFFRGHLPIFNIIFKNTNDYIITIILYIAYIFIPALFYLPSYIKNKKLDNEISNKDFIVTSK